MKKLRNFIKPPRCLFMYSCRLISPYITPPRDKWPYIHSYCSNVMKFLFLFSEIKKQNFAETLHVKCWTHCDASNPELLFSLFPASCFRGAESLLAFLLNMLSERSRYTVKSRSRGPNLTQPVYPPPHPTPPSTTHWPLPSCPTPDSNVMSSVIPGNMSRIQEPANCTYLWHFF